MKSIILNGRQISDYQIQIDGVDFYDYYNRKIPFNVLKVLRNTPLVKKSLGSWANKIRQYDVILVMDSDANYRVLEWISKKASPKARKIMYYRNCILSLRKEVSPEYVKKLGYELWSYNLTDCKKYSIRYNPQMIRSADFTNRKKMNNHRYDIVFLGNAKGRNEYIKNLFHFFTEIGMNCYFYIPDMLDFEGNQCKNGSRLNYSDYINLIYESSAILDIVTEKNYGLTLRPIEALFSERKLITNYKEIDQYDFYCKENIYILKENLNVNDLKDFFKKAYCKIDKSIVENYDIRRWYDHFFE